MDDNIGIGGVYAIGRFDGVAFSNTVVIFYSDNGGMSAANFYFPDREISKKEINKAFSKLEQEYERPPSAEELAEALEVPEDKIKESLNVSGRHVSMDAPLTTNEDGGTLMDVMANNDAPKTDQALMAESLQKEIERSLSTLTDKEREIIRLFFGIGMNHGLTLEEIGSQFNLTRERVRQIKEKAIRRLRHTSRNKLLKSYLG